jgi:hypothetical protein
MHEGRAIVRFGSQGGRGMPSSCFVWSDFSGAGRSQLKNIARRKDPLVLRLGLSGRESPVVEPVESPQSQPVGPPQSQAAVESAVSDVEHQELELNMFTGRSIDSSPSRNRSSMSWLFVQHPLHPRP